MTDSKPKIAIIALILLIISAIDSNRNLPASAIFGAPLIFFFLFSAVFFLLPSTLVAAELSAISPNKGGIYHWVYLAFGDKWAMHAIWLQWVNTMVWYPTILSFIAGTLAYLFNPDLLNNKLYMILTVSGIFWGLTILNLWGVHVSAKLTTVFALSGTVFPVLFLIVLGFMWIGSGAPLQIPFTLDSILPALEKFDTWTALEAVMASFIGIELTCVHVGHVHLPHKTFPKALLISSIYILATMLFGSLAIAIVLPASEISLTGGIMQVFDDYFVRFNMPYLVPVMTLLIVIGSLGGIINWLISPAKGLHHASLHGFLPHFFTKLNKHRVEYRILILQAVLVTLVCSVIFMLPTVNAFYWFLTALSNGLYMHMYFFMFLAVFKLRAKTMQQAFKIPFGKPGLILTSSLGLIGCTLTIIFGFVPPHEIFKGPAHHYVLLFLAGNVILISPAFLFIEYKKWKNRKA